MAQQRVRAMAHLTPHIDVELRQPRTVHSAVSETAAPKKVLDGPDPRIAPNPAQRKTLGATSSILGRTAVGPSR